MINVFQYTENCEAVFEQFMQSVGKERKTTFFSDLSIAEYYGTTAVMETYKNVMKSWKTDINYMCEWVIALNQKIWQHYESNPELGKLYDELWRMADEFCMDKFEGDDLTAYLNYVD